MTMLAPGRAPPTLFLIRPGAGRRSHRFLRFLQIDP